MFQYTPLVVPLAVATAMATVGLYFTWRKRDGAAETWMAAVFGSIAAWSLLHLLLVSVRDPATKRALLAVIYPVAITLPLSMFVFTLHYTGRKGFVTRRRLLGLFAIPVSLIPITLANPASLAFVDLTFVEGPTAVAQYEFGPALYLYAAVGHVAATAALWMLSLKFLRSRSIYRKLSFVLLLTTATMLGGNVATYLGLSPFRHMILLPLAFVVFGSVSVLTTVSVRFVQLTPIDRALSKLGGVFGSLVPLARDVVIEELQSGVVVLDDDDRIVDVNSVGKSIVAPGGRRIVGRRVWDVVDESEFVVDGTSVFAPDTSGRFESVWVTGPDGDQRCYDVSVTEVSAAPDAASSGRVVLLHDITAQQQRKRELREKKERLEDFADIVSHDLRNPVNVAEGYLDQVAAEVDTEAGEAHVEEVRESHDRIGEIIENVLILAREGAVVEDPDPVALASLARDAWDGVDTQDATLDCRLDESVVVHADRPSLLRALENLVRNAVEHGGTAVTVRVGCLDDGSGFYVEDSGEGLPETGDHVFEQGYSTSADGTGFGLSVVADVVAAHDWTVEATNGTDGGARFEIRTTDGVASPTADGATHSAD